MNRCPGRFIYRLLAEHGMKGKIQGALKEGRFSRPGRRNREVPRAVCKETPGHG
jgi:hypothetical protein